MNNLHKLALKILLLATAARSEKYTISSKVKASMILNNLKFVEVFSRPDRVSVIQKRCILKKISYCSYGGSLCKVSLQYANCDATTALSGYCDKGHVQFKLFGKECDTAELDSKIIHLYKPKKLWDMSGFKVETKSGSLYSIGSPPIELDKTKKDLSH